MTENMYLDHLRGILINITHYCKIFDDGHPYIAFDIATAVEKALSENKFSVKIRSEKKFKTVLREESRFVLSPMNKLIIAILGNRENGEPYVNFAPHFSGKDGSSYEHLIFKDWWNRDIIYRAGAGKPEDPPDLIPLRQEDQIPFARRESLSRRRFVELMRNKLGAHLDIEQPELLERIQKANMFGFDLGIEQNGRVYATYDNSIDVGVAPAAAMMRQIAWEVLDAYKLDFI